VDASGIRPTARTVKSTLGIDVSAGRSIVFRYAEAISQRVEHVDQYGPEPGRIPRLILALIVRPLVVAGPRVREWLPFIGMDDPFQTITLVPVRDVFEVKRPARERETAQRAPLSRQLNSHGRILAAPLRCVCRNRVVSTIRATRTTTREVP
jgi:hypothetical protein